MATIQRKATAHWMGTGNEGNGHLSTYSGALKKIPYSFTTRFKNEDDTLGTNSEELIAAAHVACFVMKLSFILGDAGFVPTSLDARSDVFLDTDAGYINKIKLNLEATVPGISHERFQQLAEEAKENCPISKSLKADISLTALLK